MEGGNQIISVEIKLARGARSCTGWIETKSEESSDSMISWLSSLWGSSET